MRLDFETRQLLRKARSEKVLKKAKTEMRLFKDYFDVGHIDHSKGVPSGKIRKSWDDNYLFKKTGLTRLDDGNLMCIECGRSSHPHATRARHFDNCIKLKEKAA